MRSSTPAPPIAQAISSPTPYQLPFRVTAIEKQDDQYQVIVEISPNIVAHSIRALERSNRTAVALRMVGLTLSAIKTLS